MDTQSFANCATTPNSINRDTPGFWQDGIFYPEPNGELRRELEVLANPSTQIELQTHVEYLAAADHQRDEVLTWDSARGKDDEALADELAREWDLERLQAENFSPFKGTFLGGVECKEGLDDN